MYEFQKDFRIHQSNPTEQVDWFAAVPLFRQPVSLSTDRKEKQEGIKSNNDCTLPSKQFERT